MRGEDPYYSMYTSVLWLCINKLREWSKVLAQSRAISCATGRYGQRTPSTGIWNKKYFLKNKMLQQRWLYVAVATVACVLQAQGADKYTDENRPYEFGFNIEGEQHRHEKKDENGLIMGEFGFITADGVYHVTVYATDENGNFKILSMKNIRTKPYPTAPERKGHSLPLPPSKNPPQTQGPVPQKPSSSVPAPPPASPARSCSHCSIPTTTTRQPQLTDLAVVSQDEGHNQFGEQHSQGGQKYPGGQQNYPGPNANGPSAAGPQYPQGGSDPNYPQGAGENYPQQPNYSQGERGIPAPGQALQTPLGNNPVDRNPKQFTDYPNGPEGSNGPNKPTLISAQMQIVDRNTDIHHKNPGEKDGLPDGLTKDDMVRLLYTFNYTVGFHGHYEEGYTNGNKQGYYFVTGRNGVKTRVDYVADEKGFRPKISQEVLDLLSDDVPKPETEKDEKFGLKGYEFKWLYYPADSSRQ